MILPKMPFRLAALMILFGFTLLISCSAPTENKKNTVPEINWTPSNSIVCYGTGFTYGLGVRTDSTHSATFDSTYPAFLQKRLKIDVINFGVPEASTLYGINHVDSVLSFNPVLVLLEFGAEEYFQGIEPTEVQSNLQTMIEYFQAHDVRVVLLSFAHPEMSALYPNNQVYEEDIQRGIRYYNLFQGLADYYDLPLVDYLFRDVWGDPVLMSDSIHPNGKGYQQVEYNLSNTLYDIFQRNGMLK